MITAAIVLTPIMLVAGVSGEEDPRSGQRTAVCHEGPEKSYSERCEPRVEMGDETEATNGVKSFAFATFPQHVEKATPHIQISCVTHLYFVKGHRHIVRIMTTCQMSVSSQSVI